MGMFREIACFLMEVTKNMSRIIRIRFCELWKLMEFLPKLIGFVCKGRDACGGQRTTLSVVYQAWSTSFDETTDLGHAE